MRKRLGGTVYLESACITAFMKWDGEKDETIEANYPNRATSQCASLVQRVLAYFKHDMVAIFFKRSIGLSLSFFMPGKMFIV